MLFPPLHFVHYDAATKKPSVYEVEHAATPRFATTMDAEPEDATVFATTT